MTAEKSKLEEKDLKRMIRMFSSLDLFVLGCLFAAVESQAGPILPPRNLSLQWKNDFQPHLSWMPPLHSVENCSEVYYEVSTNTKAEYSESVDTEIKSHHWENCIVMEGGFLNLSARTRCGDEYSKRVLINITYPDLVKNLECRISTSIKTNCFWDPVSYPPEPSFYYRLDNEDMTRSAQDTCLSSLQACPSYTYTDGVRTGCELKAKMTQSIVILFNVTLSNMLVRNTFKKELKVKPPPLQWEVVKAGDQFNISWTPPDIADLSEWTFKINYTECDDRKFDDTVGKTSIQLKRVSHCQYRMAIRAELNGAREGETPWSEEKYFRADHNATMFAVIIIPLMIAGLAILTFVCYRKNKDTIFPRVPKPADFLSDISDNNNKSTVPNLYRLEEEEESCKITLVIDPQNNKVCS